MRILSSGVGAEVGVVFGRAKLRQMKMMGMSNVSKTYQFMGMTVSIEITGVDEIIRVQGGATAFFVNPDWTVEDADKNDGSFVIPRLKSISDEQARGTAKKYLHGKYVQKPLSYWVSEDLKNTVNFTNQRAMPFDGVLTGANYIAGGGDTKQHKNGKPKKTTKQAYVAGMFGGKLVYVTFPDAVDQHRYADVRIADSDGEQPDTQVATFSLDGATELVLSDVDIDSNLDQDRQINTWTASSLPLTFTGTGCFTPDGKTIYLLCGTVGQKSGSIYNARHAYAKKHVFAIYLKKSEIDGKVEASGSMWGVLGRHETRRNGAWRDDGVTTCHRIDEGERTSVLAVYPVKIEGGYRPAAFEVTQAHSLTTDDLDLVTSRPALGGRGLSRTGAGAYSWSSSASILADGKVLATVSPPPSTWVFDRATWDENGNLFGLSVLYPQVIPELLSTANTSTVVLDVVGFDPASGVLVYGMHTDTRTKEAGEPVQATRGLSFVVAKNGSVCLQADYVVTCADDIQEHVPIPLSETTQLADRYSDQTYRDVVTVGLGHAFGAVSSPMAYIGDQVGIQFNGRTTEQAKVNNLCTASIDGVALVSLIAQCRPSGDYGYGEGNDVIKEIFKFDPDIPSGLENGKLFLLVDKEDDQGTVVTEITEDFLENRNDGKTAFPLISVSTTTG